MVRQEFLHTIKAGIEGNKLSLKEILFLLSSKDQEENELLWTAADRVRQNWVGDEIHLRGIVEFSNFCVQNCLYCGLRRDNHRLFRYRMSTAEIVQAAKKARSLGLPTIVLQSGEDPWFSRDRLSNLIRDIKEQTNLTLTLAVGERGYADYYAWKKAGADRYLLKHETASADLIKTLRPGHRLAGRLKALRWLQELEYEVGSGNMVGLPGQTDKDLAADIQLFGALNFDMIGIGPFIAHPQTPLAAAGNGELEKALKVLAITRIITKDTNLPATTAMSVLKSEGQRKALLSGANVIMPNLTPPAYRCHYQVYPGKEHPTLEMEATKNVILAIGRRMGRGHGHRRRSRPALELKE
jgi:biotin synthase